MKNKWLFILLVAFSVHTSHAQTGAELENLFRKPPESAKPWVLWYWMQAASSKPGITADLEAMKQMGLTTKIPVLVFSTLGQEKDVEKARQLGARGYVNKSFFDFDKLYARILELGKK